jgi:hypothetical protein
VVAAVGAAATTYSVTEQQRQSKRAAGAQKEASDIAEAQRKNEEMDQRRQQVRQQRIRAAQIEQGAVNQGASDSSGELGSLSALSSNVASNLATMSGRSTAASGIYSANQRALNAQSAAQTAGAIGQIGGLAMNLAAPKAGEGLANLFSDGTSSSGSSSS